MSQTKQVIGGIAVAGFLAMFALVGSTSAGSLFAKTASAGYGGNGGGNTKVLICHKGKTISVSQSATSAHLGHGDTVGACVATR